jgi:hypothetical protein
MSEHENKHDIGEAIDEILHGGYHYLYESQLEPLIDKAEDLLLTLKRELRDRSKY